MCFHSESGRNWSFVHTSFIQFMAWYTGAELTQVNSALECLLALHCVSRRCIKSGCLRACRNDALQIIKILQYSSHSQTHDINPRGQRLTYRHLVSVVNNSLTKRCGGYQINLESIGSGRENTVIIYITIPDIILRSGYAN